MNDPSVLALHFQARAATEAAKVEHRRYLDSGAGVPWNGPVSQGILSVLQDRIEGDDIAFCEHLDTNRAAQSFWLPSAPHYLRCEECTERVTPGPVMGKGYACDGCGRITKDAGDYVGLIDAQVLLDPKPWVVGAILVTFTLCTTCQREDYDGR